MGLQEFPSKPVNKGGVIVGTVNGPTEIAIGAQDSYLVADSTTTPGAKWQTYRKYNTVQLTSGTSWTVPATVEMIDVLLIGGGSGGTTRTANTTAGNATASSPGSGGAIVYCRDYPVTPGAAITYSIGAGSNSPAPSGAANTETFPAAAGNTTFGLLTAPGALNKVGNVNGWAYTNQNSIRGVFDYRQADYNNSNGSIDFVTQLLQSNNMPLTMNMVVMANLSTTTSSSYGFYYPIGNPMGNSWSSGNMSFDTRIGIPNFFKLTSAYTAPQGTAGTNELGGSGTRLSGWGGFGGDSNATTGTNFNGAYYGAGSGVTLNSGSTSGRSSTGGNAAANSGAGGGGAYAYSSGASPLQTARSGNGGSGVIFIGYWA